MRLDFIAFVLALFGSACAQTVSPYALATAGHIGCSAEAIELTQIEGAERGPHAWVALCGHTGYACSSDRSPSAPRVQIACSELGHPHRHERRCHRSHRW